MTQTPSDDDADKTIKIEAGNDANIGTFVGRDSITNTVSTTHIEAGPTARYAVTGIAVVAVVAVTAILLATLLPHAAPNPTAIPATLNLSASQTPIPPTPTHTVTTAPATASTAPSLTPTPTLASATLPAPTPTVVHYFQTNCIPSESWNAYPREAELGACLSVSGFLAQTDSVVVKQTQIATGEQQHGLYLPLTGDVDIHFTLTVQQLLSKNARTNLALGVLNTTNGFSYVNGSIYLCYFAALQSLDTSVPIRINPGDSLCTESAAVRALTFDTPQTILVSIKSGRLVIRVDDQIVFDDFLTFTSRAFYIGYDLHDMSEMTTILSNFTVLPNE